MTSPKKKTASRRRSFQRARARATTLTKTSDPMNARRAVSFMLRQFWQFRRREKPAPGEARRMASGEERLCFESRRHGIVLIRPLGWAFALALVGGAGVVQGWPFNVAGAAGLVLAAL